MVTANRGKAVIQATREEEITVVMMTTHRLLVSGAATETLVNSYHLPVSVLGFKLQQKN